MPERKEKKPGQEKYQLSWSTSSTPSSGSSTGSGRPVNPEGYITEEVPLEEEMSSDEQTEAAPEQVETVNEQGDTVEEPVVEVRPNNEYPPFTAGNLKGFHRSPKVSPSLPSLMFNRKSLKLAALTGWSGFAAGGAISFLIRSGSLPSTSIAGLVGVWATVFAVIWILPDRLAVRK